MAKDKEQKEQKKPQGDAKQAAPKAAPQQKAPKKEGGKKDVAAPKVAAGPQEPAPPARLASFYREKVVPDLMQKFGYKTTMQVPRLRKITVNMGVGETTADKKILDHAVADMAKIAGQKPVVTKARRS